MQQTAVPLYVPGARGDLYGLYLQPLASPRGALVWLPAFAEEANCARRHVVTAARECQQHGYACLLLDPFGTGESSGDFGEATWATWRSDVQSACDWMRQRLNVPLWLAGVRAGALLAADAAQDAKADGVLLWQPVHSGRSVLDAFLRLRLATEWARGGAAGAEILRGMREDLAAGLSVEVAGYELSAALAAELQAPDLSLEACGGRAVCMEFRTRTTNEEALTASPALLRLVQHWQEKAFPVSTRVMESAPFWTSYEAPIVHGLGAASCELIALTS